MLAEAKVDVSLMTSLSSSIKDFEASAKSREVLLFSPQPQK